MAANGGGANGTISKGTLVEKLHYKGFVNCDHATRTPNEFTVHGIHDIFTSKKEMKKAQVRIMTSHVSAVVCRVPLLCDAVAMRCIHTGRPYGHVHVWCQGVLRKQRSVRSCTLLCALCSRGCWRRHVRTRCRVTRRTLQRSSYSWLAEANNHTAWPACIFDVTVACVGGVRWWRACPMHAFCPKGKRTLTVCALASAPAGEQSTCGAWV